MEKEKKNLQNIIIMLSIIIVLLVGLSIFFIIEFHEEREEIRELYEERESTYYDDTINDSDDYEKNIDITKYITGDEALNISLKDANLKQSDIYDISVERDFKYGQVVYEVDFNYQKFEYEYFINAESGKIIKSFKEIDR